MRGASALQTVMAELQGKPVRLFVVWEPVIMTDLAPPTTGVLSRVSDPRAVQLWDRSRALSGLLVRTARKEWKDSPQVEALKDDSIVWDCVLVFSAGRRWEKAPPRPDFADCPVVNVIDAVRKSLAESAGV